MERGSIIFVNTSKNFVGKNGSAFFGRWIMSLIVRAAYERMHDTNPRQTYILVDEASDYTDNLFEELLAKVRQFKVGCLLAYQATRQFRGKGILDLTAVKLVGLLEHEDAQIMAPQLGLKSPDFLKTLPFQDDIETQFACYVRGKPVSTIPVDFTIFDPQNLTRMSDPQYKLLLQNNRDRFGVRNQPPRSHKTETPTPEPPKPTQPPAPPKKIDLDAPRPKKRDW